ncbi:MAG: tetratricopeptide repeat protein [Thermoanaerobaculia bacterium]
MRRRLGLCSLPAAWLLAALAGIEPAWTQEPLAPVDTVAEAHFQFALAQALRYEADYAGARAAFERALELESGDPYLRLTFAEFLYQVGELDRAVTEASAARRLDPENPEPLRLLARIELRQADKSSEASENALRLFGELARLLPEDLESRVSTGRLLLSLGRFDDAATSLLEAYELRPNDVRLAELLLRAYQGAEDRAEAERGLRRVLDRFPELLNVRLALANVLVEQGRHADAAEVLRGATPEQRETVEVLRLLTLQLYRTGAWEEALEASEQWLELEPDATSARYLNALGLSALARYTEAETALRSLYEDESRSFDIARVLAEVIERQGRSVEAAELLSEAAVALERDGQTDLAERARLELVDLEARALNWSRVLEMTEELRASDDLSADGEVGLIRGQALLELGREDEAIALFGSLAEHPEVGDRARARQAEALFRVGDDQGAQAVLDQLALSGDGERLFLVARTLHRLELYDKAIPLWMQARDDDPEALDVRFWLGSAFERSGRRESAIAEFQAILKRDGLFAPALNYLGYMWAERGENLSEAVELVERAVALEPNNGAYVDSLGWAHFQLGNLEVARGHLEKAAQLVGDDAVVFEHLGDLYLALGKRSLAQESYQRALDLEDENEEAVRRKLNQLNGDS